MQKYRDDIRQIIESVDQIVYGMEKITRFLLVTIICNDHILLEDVPGTGKTLIVTTLSRILDLDFKRVQGTPDLLPGDLTGLNIYNQKTHEFKFIKGPVFTNILLFDELNRASPKTQSALLEAMAENQVSVDNKTFHLEKPFVVVATQNPIEHVGTYPPPQAQMDRFLMRVNLGFPHARHELKIMLTDEEKIEEIKLPFFERSTIFDWQNNYKKVHIDQTLSEKLLKLIQKTRDKNIFSLGISPRSGRKFIKAVKAMAFIKGRDFVNKDDIFELFLPVMIHRVFANKKGEEEIVLSELLKEASL